MAIVTYRNDTRNDTIVTTERKKDKYQVTIHSSGEDRNIAIEKRNSAMGIYAERIALSIPDWEIIKPLVEEALKEDEIMRRIFRIMKGNNVKDN